MSEIAKEGRDATSACSSRVWVYGDGNEMKARSGFLSVEPVSDIVVVADCARANVEVKVNG